MDQQKERREKKNGYQKLHLFLFKCLSLPLSPLHSAPIPALSLSPVSRFKKGVEIHPL